MGRLRTLLHASLRKRLILGIAVMLLPLLLFVTAAVGVIRPIVWGALDNAVQQWPEWIQPVGSLENLLLKSLLASKHYLISHDPAEQESFSKLAAEADAAFGKLLQSDRLGTQDRSLLQDAQTQWTQARETGRSVFALAGAEDAFLAIEAIYKFDEQVYATIALLDAVLEASHRATVEQLHWARRLGRLGPIIVVVMFAIALSFTAFIGVLLARSILRPLDVLKRSVIRIGEGDLSFRVSLDAGDELGDLAHAFNAMTEKLERNQAMLEDLSLQDELTGVFNYRGFQRRLAEEIERSHRYGRAFSLLLLDLDHFKAVNDNHGHPTGDEVLKLVVALMRSVVRPTDYVARYGGEEFAILLAETGPAGARAMAERIRELVERNPAITALDDKIEVTASLGVASYPDHASSETELVSAADAALYAAKRSGRNRVCQAGAQRSNVSG